MANLFGITGTIGSGKSFMSQALRERGYQVFDSDTEAHRIMEHNPMVRSQIEWLFGSDIYQSDKLNRREVARQVFSDAALLTKLNSIVHPAVGFELQQWAKEQPQICFVESALMYESGLYKWCKAVILVSAPLEVRLQRAMQRDKSDREQIINRLNNQTNQAELQLKCDLIIENDGKQTADALCLQIIDFCNTFVG